MNNQFLEKIDRITRILKNLSITILCASLVYSMVFEWVWF